MMLLQKKDPFLSEISPRLALYFFFENTSNGGFKALFFRKKGAGVGPGSKSANLFSSSKNPLSRLFEKNGRKKREFLPPNLHGCPEKIAVAETHSETLHFPKKRPPQKKSSPRLS